jgi:glyoxylase-like metal-dependent hydrolase (beta-lactamase superfamily II)
MRRLRRGLLALVAVVVAIATVVIVGQLPSPLPEPPPLEVAVPEAHPPAEMSIAAMATGVDHRSAAAAYRGGSPRDARDFTMTAVLVRHPRGDLLVDTGFGRRVREHFAAMPLAFRLVTPMEPGTPARDQLDAAGYDASRLSGILLTHAHWDHVSGIPDFPGTPVLLPADERRFVSEGGVATTVARGLAGVEWREYAFDGGPYLGFPRSHDIYGDGAIVVVPAPGHTPGSVVVFLTLPTGRRYAMVGDLCWQREGITLREERPLLIRAAVDWKPGLVREQIGHMAAVHALLPDLTLVPAHDGRQMAEIPPLPPR